MTDSRFHRLAQMLSGGHTFGGHTFGGQTFGGNTFGGNATSQPPASPAPYQQPFQGLHNEQYGQQVPSIPGDYSTSSISAYNAMKPGAQYYSDARGRYFYRSSQPYTDPLLSAPSAPAPPPVTSASFAPPPAAQPQPQPMPQAPPPTAAAQPGPDYPASLPPLPPPQQVGPQAQPMLPDSFVPNMTAAQAYQREFAANPGAFDKGWLARLLG